MSRGYKIFARSQAYRDHFDETFYPPIKTRALILNDEWMVNIIVEGEDKCQEETDVGQGGKAQEQVEDLVGVHQ